MTEWMDLEPYPGPAVDDTDAGYWIMQSESGSKMVGTNLPGYVSAPEFATYTGFKSSITFNFTPNWVDGIEMPMNVGDRFMFNRVLFAVTYAERVYEDKSVLLSVPCSFVTYNATQL